MKPPLVIQIICHDLGKHCAPYTPEVPAPQIEAFSREAVIFHRAHCASPACSPSRGCLMTGCHSLKNGMIGLAHLGWSMPRETETIVDWLNAAGVTTAHAGHQHERTTLADNHYQIEKGNRAGASFCEEAFAEALSILEAHDPAKPLYLNVGTMETHISQWGNMNRHDRRALYGECALEEVYLPPNLPDLPVVRESFAPFQACIRYFDTELGRFLQALREGGYYDQALILFTTDHGISGLRSKGTLYEAGVETALMVKMPQGEQAGTQTQALTSNIDIAPTLLEYFDVSIPEHVDGRSFLPLLRGDATFAEREVSFIERNYHSNFDPMRSIRTRDFHYTLNFADDPKEEWTLDHVPPLKDTYKNYINELWQPLTRPRAREELFDLRADPHETVNRADDPALAAIKEDLHAQLMQWMDARGDYLPGPPPPPHDISRFPHS